MIAVCLRNWRLAWPALHRAAEAETRSASHWIVLGRSYLEAGRACQAVESFDAALRINPKNSLAWTLSCDALMAADRPVAAFRRLDRAFEMDRSNCSFLTLQRLIERRCQARLTEGEEGRQIRRLMRRLMRLAPQHARTHCSLASLHWAKGDWNGAQRCLSDFAHAHPRHAKAWCHLGWLLVQAGKEGLAADAFRTAFQIDPSDFEVRCAMARLLSKSGSLADLHRLIEATLRIFPENPGALRTAAWALSFHARCQSQAIELLEQAAQLDPGLPAIAFCKGQVLARRGLTQPAIAALESGWSLLPADDGFHHSCWAALELGTCWVSLGDHDSARKWFQRALKSAERWILFDPTVGQAARGFALMALRDRSSAADAFQSALSQGLAFPLRSQVQSALAGRRCEPEKDAAEAQAPQRDEALFRSGFSMLAASAALSFTLSFFSS